MTAEYCEQCDHHQHVCGGCGEHLPHGSYICNDCRTENAK